MKPSEMVFTEIPCPLDIGFVFFLWTFPFEMPLWQSKGLLDEAGPTQERCEWKEGILWGIQDGGGNTSTHDVSFSRKILLVEDYGRPGWDVRLGPDQKKP